MFTEADNASRAAELLDHEWRLLAGGELVRARSGRTYPDASPYTEKVIAEVPDADSDDVAAAVRAAREAAPGWRRTPVPQRARLIEQLAGAIEARARDFHPRARRQERPDSAPRRRSRRGRAGGGRRHELHLVRPVLRVHLPTARARGHRRRGGRAGRRPGRGPPAGVTARPPQRAGNRHLPAAVRQGHGLSRSPGTRAPRYSPEGSGRTIPTPACSSRRPCSAPWRPGPASRAKRSSGRCCR